MPKKRAKSKSSSALSAKKDKASAAAVKARRQTAAVLVLAFAVLFLCIAIIPGGSLWGLLHRLILGLFGVCAYIFPVFMVYISIITAMEKPVVSVSSKLWQSLMLIVMIASAIQIFMYDFEGGTTFFNAVKNSFEEGNQNRGGGVLGAVFGYALEYFFTDLGAKIIIILLIAVFLMLVTGTTVIALFKAAVLPVEKAKASIENAMIASQEKKKAIDIDIGEGYAESSGEVEKSEKLKQFEKVAKEFKKLDEEKAKQTEDAAAETVEIGDLNDSAGQDGSYRYPPISLLYDNRASRRGAAAQEQKATAELLVKTLRDFGIETRIVDISVGPTVTRYELEPSAGVKISKITGLSDDLALRLATSGVRIEAPIPNKAAVGIEVPNRKPAVVTLRELIDSDEFASAKSPLTVALGKDISGGIVLADLTRMPHLLIAGTTGSGKSVCTNAMIQSVLFKASPKEVRMLLVDPKQVEFNVYNGIPHLLAPVVTDPRKAAGVLGWAVSEMLKRYKLFAENNVRDFNSFNELAERSDELTPMPLILIVIDELADLMMVAANEVEDAIIRLAQMARAAGMHLVVATQRPSVDVITGLIKANIPSRLALTVASAVDSRTILDAGGAEKLLGRGDMLFMPVGMLKPMRVQGCFVSDKEVEAVVSFIKNSQEHEYDEEVIEEIDKLAAAAGSSAGRAEPDDDETDEMLPQAIEAVVEAGSASTSLLQRRLRLGYARAGRLIDEMEKRGIIGPYEGSKPRQVLITRQQWLEMNYSRADDDE